MKAQDIVIVLLLVGAEPGKERNIPALSGVLGVSTSVVHDSLRRLTRVALVRPRTYEPVRPHLKEFLEHGMRFVFPAELGRVTRGVPTASSAPPLASVFGRGEIENEFVWPSAEGHMRGTSLQPLHSSVPDVALRVPALHELLAIADGLRVQDPRVRQESVRAMRERLDGGDA